MILKYLFVGALAYFVLRSLFSSKNSSITEKGSDKSEGDVFEAEYTVVDDE